MATNPPPDIEAMTGALAEITRHVIEAERAARPATPAVTPPDFVTHEWTVRLIEQAELDRTDVLILRILLAAEVEPRAYRCLQRLAGDPTQAGVAVDALVIAIRAMAGTSVDVLRALRPHAALVERGLVRVHGEEHTPPLVRRLTLPSALVDYVLTGHAPPASTEPLLVLEPPVSVAELCPVGARDDEAGVPVVEHLRRALPKVLRGEPLWLTGPPGIGRKTLVAALAAELGSRVLVLRCEDALAAFDPALPAKLWCELLLRGAILCLADADARLTSLDVPGDAPAAPRTADAIGAVYGLLHRARLPMVVTSDQPPSTQELERPPFIVRFGTAKPADTLALWRAHLPGAEAIEEVSTRFRLTPGRIVRAATAAKEIAATLGRATVEQRDVAQAIRVSVAQQVAVLGTLVEESQSWDDVVLPDDTRASVRELVARVQHRHAVLDVWGFRSKMSKGLGLAALFSGPPGTGKTMIASLVARALGQELYQIDLSRVVSKWIGETEKNLARIFDAAEGANVLLLFDEADALFAKRTEVKSSNDRHANAEVNYLLQRVERFEGICILTTNFEGSIDPAFKRRLAFRMVFPLPDAAERTELWRRMMPRAADVADDVDFDELGEAYELAGGHIRNAVLRAAFFAASERRPIGMELLERAVRLEYHDAGKFTTVGRIV